MCAVGSSQQVVSFLPPLPPLPPPPPPSLLSLSCHVSIAKSRRQDATRFCNYSNKSWRGSLPPKPSSGRRSHSERPPIRPRSPAALSRVFIRQAHSFSNYCTKWGCNIATPPFPPSTQRGAGLTLRQPELANSLAPWAGPVHRQPINEPLNKVAPPTSHLCRDIYILKVTDRLKG